MNASLLTLPILFLAGLEDPPPEEKAAAEVFAPPVRLMAEGAPLGNELLYPSPALFDIDGDGDAELVLGDLRGALHVCERVPGGDLTWTAPKKLESVDGEPLDFSNW